MIAEIRYAARMRPNLPTLGAVCFLLGTTFASRAEVREWTRASDGRTIRAEFAGMKDEATVKIRTAKGHVFEAPLASLSAEDNEYVRAAMEKAAPEPMLRSAKPSAPSAGVTVTLSGVHLCCGDCVEAVAKIGTEGTHSLPKGVSIAGDRSAKSIVVKAPSDKAAQTVLETVLAAGFYGASDHPGLRIPDLEEDDAIADSMVVHGAHLCCGGCVRAFVSAAESVDGVERCEARSGADTARVTGHGFKPTEVMRSLRESGFGGSLQ